MAKVLATTFVVLVALAACSSTTTTTNSAPIVSVAPTSTHAVASTSTVASSLTHSTCVSRRGLPDRRCTPGATDSRVTQATINSTICVAGYTRTIRPPTSYTNRVKQSLIVAYGETAPIYAYELDHLIPLELGGNP